MSETPTLPSRNRNMTKINEEIKNYLKILGLQETGKLPKLKEVKKSYYERSKELHPDKHSKKDEKTKKYFEEKFKELLTAYRSVSVYIIENKVDNDDDEEEVLIRKEFENVNIVTMNQKSATMTIPKEHTEAWITVLHEHFGRPIDQTRSGK